MSPYVVAGSALLVLAAAIALTHRRGVTATRDRRLSTLIGQVAPIALLAWLILRGEPWALVAGAVFASIWLIDQALSWRERLPSARAHAVLSVVSLAVAAVAWLAVAAAPLVATLPA